MTRALVHRGPDEEGYFFDPDVALHLGHRRLSIRDLSGGKQPMRDQEGTVYVVFNGEIYNHKELRETLQRAGRRFETTCSDTEILVHGFKEWGVRLAERLNGQFAFTIYDVLKNRLYLARDRFGEKPLYFSSSPSLFAFASELSALVHHRSLKTTVSRRSLAKLFGYGYIPAPLSLYEEVEKLPAGNFITVDLDNLAVTRSTYWRFELHPDEALLECDEGELAEELRALFIQSVRRRLVSDVPLGVFLSGGIDSSGIAAAAAQCLPVGALKTFAVGFSEPTYDESAYARRASEHIGSIHRECQLDLTLARDMIPEVLRKLDEPLGDPSIIPTYLLSAFTRENVTVALSGDGGDELFAGYDPFDALGPAALYDKWVPAPLHGLISQIAERLPRSSRNMSLDYKLRRTLMGLSQPESAWAPTWMAPFDPKEMDELFHQPPRVDEIYDEAMELWETGPAKTRVDRLLQFFTTFYLQDDILAKVDRATMMHSLESRAVFLDNDLVNFCCRLPSKLKYRMGHRKYLLKKALSPLLPKDILHRRKKGFGIPLSDWMCSVPAEPPMIEVPGMKIDGARKAWADHRTGGRDNRLFLWTWWSLQSHLATNKA